MITESERARYMASILRKITTELSGAAEGMWNPNFCSSDCSSYALKFCEELRHDIDWIEKRARAKPKSPVEAAE